VIGVFYEDECVSGWIKSCWLTLISVDTPYRTPLTVFRPRAGLHVTKVEALQGGYRVRFPFDREHAVGKASPSVRLVQPSVGEKKGFHFPLSVGARAICGYINDHPDHPVLLGALGVGDSTHTETQNILETPVGNKLLMDDTAGTERFSLSTSKQRQCFELSLCHNGQGIELLAHEGNMHFEAGKHLSVKAGQSIVQKVGDSCRTDAKGKLRVKAKKGNIVFQSGGHVHLSSGDGVSIKANEGVLDIKAASVKLSCVEKTSLQGKTVSLVSQRGAIHLNAKKGVSLSVGRGGKLTITQGESQIVLDSQGGIHIKAAKMIRIKGAVSGI